jgi:hypothetical protein
MIGRIERCCHPPSKKFEHSHMSRQSLKLRLRNRRGFVVLDKCMICVDTEVCKEFLYEHEVIGEGYKQGQ